MNFVFLVAGVIMLLFPPKKINGLYGYRTQRSMRNQESWDKAQRISAIKMIQISLAAGSISFLLGISDWSEKFVAIFSLVISLMGLGYLFYVTEKKLKTQ
jgi:uncharacterized membrane protein